MTLGYFSGGTVSASNGGTAVTGVGTAFTQASAGDVFEADGKQVTIASVQSDTALTLAIAYTGTALSASSAYLIRQNADAANVSLQNNLKIRDLLDALALKGEIHYVTAEPASSLGDDGDTAFDTANLNVYRKSGGAWSIVWTGVINSSEISTARVMTQTEFNALASKDANTLYAVTAG